LYNALIRWVLAGKPGHLPHGTTNAQPSATANAPLHGQTSEQPSVTTDALPNGTTSKQPSGTTDAFPHGTTSEQRSGTMNEHIEVLFSYIFFLLF
jgi:hypothetical protein